MRGVTEVPAGLVYRPDLLDEGEEADLVASFEALDFEAVVMHGQAARRTVRHFGYGYDFDSWRVRPTDPIPPALLTIRERAAAFGSVVLGISLLGACSMRFQRTAAGGERRVFEQPLERRSA